MINLLFAALFFGVFWLLFKELRKFGALKLGDYPEKAEISAVTESVLSALYKNVLFSFLFLLAFLVIFYAVFRFFGIGNEIYLNSMFYFVCGFAGFSFFACLLFASPVFLLRLNYPVLRISETESKNFILKTSLYFCVIFSLAAVFFLYSVFSFSGGTDPDFARDVSVKMPFLWTGAVFSAFIIFSNFKLYSFYSLKKEDPGSEFLFGNIGSFSENSVYALMIFLISVSFMVNSFILSSYGVGLITFGLVSLLAGLLSLLISFLVLHARWKGGFTAEKFMGIFELSAAIYLFFMLIAVRQVFNSNMWFFLAVVCGAFSGYLLLFVRNYYSVKIRSFLPVDSPLQKEFIFDTLKVLTESSSGFLFIFALFAVSSYYCGIKASRSILSDFVSGFAGINVAFTGFISVSFYLFFVSFLNSSACALKKFMIFAKDKSGVPALEGILTLAENVRFHSVNFFPGFALLAGFMSLVSYVFYFRFLTGYQADFHFGFNIDYVIAIIVSVAFSFSITSLFVLFLSFLENGGGLARVGAVFFKAPFVSSILLIIYLFLIFSLLLFAVGRVSNLLPQILFSIFFIFAIINVSIIIMVQSFLDIAGNGKNLKISGKVRDYLEAYKFYLFYIVLFFSVSLSVLSPALISG